MAESAFSSIKRTFGDHESFVKWNNIVNELMLKASTYNTFIDKTMTAESTYIKLIDFTIK